MLEFDSPYFHKILRAKGEEWLEERSADSFEVATEELPATPFVYLAELLLLDEVDEFSVEELEIVVDSLLRHLALMELVAEHTGPVNHHYVEWAKELKDIALRKLMSQRNIVEDLFANMEKLNELADPEFEERDRQKKAVFPIPRR